MRLIGRRPGRGSPAAGAPAHGALAADALSAEAPAPAPVRAEVSIAVTAAGPYPACSQCGRTDLPMVGGWEPLICQECDAAINEDAMWAEELGS